MRSNHLISQEIPMDGILFKCGDMPHPRFMKVLYANVDCAREDMESSGGIFSPLGVLARLSRKGQPFMKGVDLSIRRDNLIEIERVAQNFRDEARSYNPDYTLSMMEIRVVRGEDRGHYQQGVWDGRWNNASEYPNALSTIDFYLETRRGAWYGQARVILDDGVRTFGAVIFNETETGGRFRNLIPLRLVK